MLFDLYRDRTSARIVLAAFVLLIGGWAHRTSAHPYWEQQFNEDCSVCHGNNAAMGTTPASGGSLQFFKVLVGKSSTASFTVSDTSMIAANPPPEGGGGFTGSFPAASAPFSPTTSTGFITPFPAGATSGYTYLLPPAVVAADGGTSSISEVYTFKPTTRGAFSEPITFTPSAGGFMSGAGTTSTVTLTGTGVAPVISLTTSAAAVGNIRIGTSGAASLTINNIGDGNQAGSGLGNLTGTVSIGSGGFGGSGGSFNLADSASQTFNYTVSPTLHSALSDNIAVNAADGSTDGMNNSQNLSAMLSATGVGPTLSTGIATGGTLNFGKAVSPQAPSESTSVANVTTDANLGTLTNLDVVSIGLSGSGASMFSISGVSNGMTLTKSQSANLSVSFAPSIGFTGSATATLTLVTDEGSANGVAGKTVTYTLTGLGAMEAYWKGGHGGSWNTTSPGYNWVVASGSTTEINWLPTANTDIFFTDPNPGTTSTTLGQDLSVKSVTFSASAAPMTIGGSNTLTIESGVSVTGGTASQTISAPLLLGGSQTWTVSGSGTLSAIGSIGGSGALTKSGSGRLLLSGTDTYSGGTNVLAGTLVVASRFVLPDGSNLNVGNNTGLLGAPVLGSPLAGGASNGDPNPVPEPGTFVLLALGAVFAAICFRFRKTRCSLDKICLLGKSAAETCPLAIEPLAPLAIHRHQCPSRKQQRQGSRLRHG